ncbi:hypothetical protein B7G68_19390 [Caulobacter segnis]|uniref:Uncharacterized protein n=1 Tax=Caulobacter segnis TaxID=88688 RepID=A0ABM6TKP9_9CAUL|nr:hypothetical protein [Caulobacter segnis]AVQ03812.1 hypothetical protein B7G68_19390 [Caulobacter segnis]
MIDRIASFAGHDENQDRGKNTDVISGDIEGRTSAPLGRGLTPPRDLKGLEVISSPRGLILKTSNEGEVRKQSKKRTLASEKTTLIKVWAPLRDGAGGARRIVGAHPAAFMRFALDKNDVRSHL